MLCLGEKKITAALPDFLSNGAVAEYLLLLGVKLMIMFVVPTNRKSSVICLLSLWSVCWFWLETRRRSSQHIKREVLALFSITFLFFICSPATHTFLSLLFHFSSQFYLSSHLESLITLHHHHSSVKSTINLFWSLSLTCLVLFSLLLLTTAPSTSLDLLLLAYLLLRPVPFHSTIPIIRVPTSLSISFFHDQENGFFFQLEPTTNKTPINSRSFTLFSYQQPFYTQTTTPLPTPFDCTLSHPPQIPPLVPSQLDANKQT